MASLEEKFNSAAELAIESAFDGVVKHGGNEEGAKDQDTYDADDASYNSDTCGGCERCGCGGNAAVVSDCFVCGRDLMAVRAASKLHSRLSGFAGLPNTTFLSNSAAETPDGTDQGLHAAST